MPIKITVSMQLTIDETTRRREKQIAYNTEHGLTPKTILKSKEEIMQQNIGAGYPPHIA
jgi:excinuclease ABC subunit B